MALKPETVRFDGFEGLNNKDELLGPPYFEELTNMDVDDKKHIVSRPGFVQALADAVDGYSSRFGNKAYVIDSSGTLFEFDGTTATQIDLFVGFPPYHWCEMGQNVYLSTSTETHEIRPDGVYEWGLAPPSTPSLEALSSGSLPEGAYQVAITHFRDSDGEQSPSSEHMTVFVPENGSIAVGAIAGRTGFTTNVWVSKPNGPDMYLAAELLSSNVTCTIDGDPDNWMIPLETADYDKPYPGSNIAYYDGRVWITEYDTTHEYSVLHFSERNEPYRFSYDFHDTEEFPIVNDEIRLMAGTEQGILVGGAKGIYGVTVAGESEYNVDELADYGVPKGRADWLDKNTVFFWSDRGLCRAFSFSNVTEDKLRVKSGESAAVLIRHFNGYKTVVASVSGPSDVFNSSPSKPTRTFHNNGLTV